MNDESRPKAAPDGSGGPGLILPGNPDVLREVSDDARYVKIPSVEYIGLAVDAGMWRMLRTSPHVASLLEEWSSWDERRRLREASWDIAESSRGRWDHVSYAEIERRRNVVEVPSWAVSGNAKLAKRREAAA